MQIIPTTLRGGDVQGRKSTVCSHSEKMDKFSIQKYCFLFVLCNLICRCPSEAAEDKRQARDFLIDLNENFTTIGQIMIIAVLSTCIWIRYTILITYLRSLYRFLSVISIGIFQYPGLHSLHGSPS